MRPTILAALISASLLWSSMPAGQTCRSKSCAQAGPSAAAGQVSPVAPRLSLASRTRVVGPRACIGLLRRPPVSPTNHGSPMVVTSELPHWV